MVERRRAQRENEAKRYSDFPGAGISGAQLDSYERKRARSHDDAVDDVGDVKRWEAGLSINIDALEEELQKQPDAFYQVGRALAEAISIRDAEKQELAETEAEYSLEFRRTAAGDKDSKKPTEKEIDANMTTDKGVIAANKRLNAAQHNVNLLSTLKDAYKDRGYALGRLVDLHLEGYYGGEQSTRGHTSRLKNDTAARAKSDIADHLKNRRERERDRQPPWKD